MQDFRSIYGSMMQEYVVGRIRALNAERDARLAALKTKEDAQAYVETVRAKIAKVFSSMPADRSVPKSELTGTVERERFRIENHFF